METEREGILTQEAQHALNIYTITQQTNKQTQPAKTGQELDSTYSLNKYMGQWRDFNNNYGASRASLIYMLIGCTSKRQ